jgi:hypothetical protein
MTGLKSPGLSGRGEDVKSMDTDPDDDQPTDRGWDNRRLILASLAPRTATRPARRGAAPDADADPAAAKKPGLLSRGLRASGRAAAAGGRAFDNRVPRENRARVAIITVAAVVILLVALAGVNFLTTDVNPPATPTTATAHPPPPTGAAEPGHDPVRRQLLTCARDPNYPDSNSRSTATSTPRGCAPGPRTRRTAAAGRLRPPGHDHPDPGDRRLRAVAPDGTDQWSSTASSPNSRSISPRTSGGIRDHRHWRRP